MEEMHLRYFRNSMYLSSLRVAAASAADAARTDDMARYEAATVFVTVHLRWPCGPHAKESRSNHLVVYRPTLSTCSAPQLREFRPLSLRAKLYYYFYYYYYYYYYYYGSKDPEG